MEYQGLLMNYLLFSKNSDIVNGTFVEWFLNNDLSYSFACVLKYIFVFTHTVIITYGRK